MAIIRNCAMSLLDRFVIQTLYPPDLGERIDACLFRDSFSSLLHPGGIAQLVRARES
ncbi:protein of unknown function [Aminobacter niigataensis]|nr:protein of unknown function [Aminobacter niigataensis]